MIGLANAGDGINGTIYGTAAGALQAVYAKYGDDAEAECEVVPIDRCDVDAQTIR